jgi:hypothetical protein
MQNATIFIETRARAGVEKNVVLECSRRTFDGIECTSSAPEYVETNLGRSPASLDMKRLTLGVYMPRPTMNHDAKTPQHPVFGNNVFVHRSRGTVARCCYGREKNTGASS